MAELDKLDKVETTSKPLWLMGCLTIIMLFLIATIGIYDHIKKKRAAASANDMHKMRRGEGRSKAKIEPLEIHAEEYKSINESIPTNLQSFPPKRSKSCDLGIDDASSLFNERIIHSHSFNSSHTRIVKRTIESGLVIPKSDADTQTKTTIGFKKKEDIRTKGCCFTTMVTVGECHGLVNPFIEEKGGLPRRDKLLILYLELILYIWISAIFFDLSGNQMTAMGLIVLALAVMLLTLPPVMALTKLLTRPGLPEKYMDEEGGILITAEQEVNKWRRRQCYWTICGYLFGWVLIIVFTCHILVMTIVMGKSTTNLWLIALLITAIIDYCFLQPIKGFVLMCCLSEGCVDFIITFLSGNLI